MTRTTDQARAVVARLKSAQRLPSPPGVALRVIELCRRDDTDSRQIGGVIDADPVLTARLLRYANSPLAGIATRVTSSEQAIRFLGFRNVQVIALGFSLASGRTAPRCPRFDLREFWATTVVRAVLARRMAEYAPVCDPVEAFTAGLLSGLGRLALAIGVPEEYDRALAAASLGAPLREAEIACMGVDHADFGSAMLEDWRLPSSLVDAVRCQFDPSSAPDNHRGLAHACHRALRLAPLLLGGAAAQPSQTEALARVIEVELALAPPAWVELSGRVAAEARELSGILDVDAAGSISEATIFAEAHRLATRLAMSEQADRQRLMEDQAQLLHRASSDALTGLANRAKFDLFLEETVAAARRGRRRFALILFDLDDFKSINDTLGHPAGDRALREVSRVVREHLREGDLFARLGGDEFAIVAAEADRAQACRIAQRINIGVASLRIEAAGHSMPVTVSVGIATYPRPGDVTDAVGLLEAADRELYRSKRGGRNRWSCTEEAA